MRTVTPEQTAALKDGRVATLVRCVLKNGTVLAYTDHDLPIQISGTLYMPEPSMKPAKITATADAEIGNREFEGGWDDILLSEDDLKAGVLDGAKIQVLLFPWSEPGLGALEIFAGVVGAAAWTEDGWKIDVQSSSKVLARAVGIETTPSCRHQLFSQPAPGQVGACRLNPAMYTYSGSITEITDQKTLVCSLPAVASGWLSYGLLTFNSGAAAGWSCEVRRHSGTGIELFLPCPYPLEVGDDFTITAGCDKTWDTCKAKFNNGANYGGMPHLQSDVLWR